MNAIDDVPNNSLKCNFNVIVSNRKRNMRAIDWIVSAYDFCQKHHQFPTNINSSQIVSNKVPPIIHLFICAACRLRITQSNQFAFNGQKYTHPCEQ